jgi:hypothetical protein
VAEGQWDMSKLSVRFYERENYFFFTNNQTVDPGGHRLPEVLLREVIVVLTNEPSNAAPKPN